MKKESQLNSTGFLISRALLTHILAMMSLFLQTMFSDNMVIGKKQSKI